ncbi:MAG: epimerase [Marmoricola sp.]|jgi:putative membrane protein|nr:epimerase [Marmoricola sp.]
MLIVACVLAAVAALLHVYIFVLESVRWEHPATRRVFGTTAETAATTKGLAYNQGFYNLFLAVGAAAGAVVAPHDGAIGLTLLLFTCGSMLAAALVLLLSDRSKTRAALVQGTFPALAVLAGLVALS